MPNFYDSQHAQNEGVVLAHTLMGTPVGQTTAAAASDNPDVANAASLGLSTRPYKAPGQRKNEDKLCQVEGGCRGYRMKSVPYCPGHARSLGLVDKHFKPVGEPTDEHSS